MRTRILRSPSSAKENDETMASRKDTIRPSLAPTKQPSFRPTSRPSEMTQLKLLTTLTVTNCPMISLSSAEELTFESSLAAITSTDLWSNSLLNTTMDATNSTSTPNITATSFTFHANFQTTIVLSAYPRFHQNTTTAMLYYQHLFLATSALNVPLWTKVLRDQAMAYNATALIDCSVKQLSLLHISSNSLTGGSDTLSNSANDDGSTQWSDQLHTITMLIALSVVGALALFVIYLCIPRPKFRNTFQVHITDL